MYTQTTVGTHWLLLLFYVFYLRTGRTMVCVCVVSQMQNRLYQRPKLRQKTGNKLKWKCLQIFFVVELWLMFDAITNLMPFSIHLCTSTFNRTTLFVSCVSVLFQPTSLFIFLFNDGRCTIHTHTHTTQNISNAETLIPICLFAVQHEQWMNARSPFTSFSSIHVCGVWDECFDCVRQMDILLLQTERFCMFFFFFLFLFTFLSFDIDHKSKSQ